MPEGGMFLVPAWVIITAVGLTAAFIIMFYFIRSEINRQKKIIKVYDRVNPAGKQKLPRKHVEVISAGYREKRQSDMYAYFQSYKKAMGRINIPSGALTVKKCACVFCLDRVILSHYIWRGESALYFFPVWRDIALYLADPSYIPVTDGSERGLISGWAIPLDYITYYVADEINGITTVYYEDKENRRYKTVFLEGGGKALRALLPEKDYDLLKRRKYLGSYNNILEMNERISQLKIKKEQGIISGQEYEAQKEYVMRNL